MAAKPVVPKFGSWDAENIGYTVFFEKVRENKTTPVPATAAPTPKGRDDYEFDPYEHYENLSRNAPSRPASSQGHGHAAAPAPYYENSSRNAPSSRPPSSHGHGHPGQQHGYGGYHRRNGSNGSSAASEVSSRGSKFSPPRPYQPRYSSNNSNGSYHQPQQQQYVAPGPRHHHQYATPAPRASASPPRHAPPPVNERRPSQGVPPQARAAKAPSAVPKFGVWDDQNSAQGFTVQFEKVQRQREVAKVAAPDVPRPQQQLSPDRAAPEWSRPRRKPKKSFLSKVYGCLFPVVRQ